MDTDSVFAFVKRNGPVIPRDVVKELGGDTFIVGAILSTLANENKIRISSAKIGGSPLYYAEGQEERIQKLYDYLHEKEKKAFDMLKKEKILKDTELQPVYRVALRNIRDFARPVEVNLKDNKVLFWKWYLVSTNEASAAIKNYLSQTMPQIRESPATEKVEPKKPAEPTRKEPPKTVPAVEKKPIVQTTISAPLEQKDVKKKDTALFLEKVQRAFAQKSIEIVDTDIIKKNSEADMIILVPSEIGKIRFFCKVVDKKKITDRDLSSAAMQGQHKRLPIIFATSGTLSKKTEDMLNNELLGVLIYRF